MYFRGRSYVTLHTMDLNQNVLLKFSFSCEDCFLHFFYSFFLSWGFSVASPDNLIASLVTFVLVLKCLEFGIYVTIFLAFQNEEMKSMCILKTYLKLHWRC